MDLSPALLCLNALAAPSVTVPTYEPSRSLAPLVEAVAPAVVTLEVQSAATLPDLPAEVLRALPFDPRSFPQSRMGQGSGFFVSGDGEVLTNWHVVDGARAVTVVLADGRRLPARVVGGDRSLDVALLSVDAKEPWLELGDSDGLRVGDWVLAMGNGLGLGSAATVGIVSGRGRNVANDALAADFIQTDAAINEGNSGGPVFSLDGHVIGVSTATVLGANTIGFAIPAARVRAILPQLRSGEHVSRGYLGLGPKDGPGGGAIVESLVAGAPASAAGLAVGDRILRVDGEAIDDAKDLVLTVAARRPGQRVEIAYDRGGRTQTVLVELAERPSAEVLAPATARPRGPVTVSRQEVQGFAGLSLRSSSPSPEPGVTVDAVRSGTPFDGHLRAGDRITAVNRHAVTSASEVREILERSAGDVSLEVVREGGARTLVVPYRP